MSEKQVSFKVDADVYKVLKHYATLDERSVRSWFERYIKATFKADYNAVLNNTKLSTKVVLETNPHAVSSTPLKHEYIEDIVGDNNTPNIDPLSEFTWDG